MPELFTLLLKVNIALVLFCLGYYLVLRKLTFYTLNRAYLITGIIFSSAYPFIDLSVFAQRHHQIVAPVQNVVIVWQAPAQNLVKQAAYWNWLEILFWAGAIVFAARLLFQLASLYKIYKRSTADNINGQQVRIVKGDISPFSFWKSIYVNPEKLSSTDLKNVLAHEQVHVDEWHTLDILLTEISVIFYWFNPGIWMMKRAVRENIEFITDRKILQKGLDSKAYQYSLLNITFNQPAPAISSNFNFSTLKKRITMMNAKRSSNLNLTRYALLVPVVMICLLTFSLSKAEAVKRSAAFKAVAATVKQINNAVLPHDTVPATTRAVTGTVTVQKGPNRTTKTITIKGADVNNLTFKIDSPDMVPQTVTVRGKRPGQKDSVITFTIGGKPIRAMSLQGFKSIGTTDSLRKISAYSYFRSADGYRIAASENAATKTAKTLKGDSINGNRVYYSFSIKADSVNKFRIVPSLRLSSADTTNRSTSYRVVQGRPTRSVGRTDTTGRPALYKVIPGTPIRDSNGLWHVTTDLNGKQTTGVQPLFIVDGKEVNQKDLKSFEGNVVYLTPETAIMKYGAKGDHGALIINTKDAKK